jgi:glycosyltransferase involved in cell wall biosynthesis
MAPGPHPADDDAVLSVAFDATPLLMQPTGVGMFCAGALAGLADRTDVEVSAYAVSWRRRKGIDGVLPPGVGSRQRPMPARPLHWAWARGRLPPVDWFIGRHDVVHGSNFVVPPSSGAARIVSVHDLTVVLYPELCRPTTLVFTDLIRRAISEGAWVHTDSQFVAGQVIAELDANPDRVRTVHLGVPTPPEFPAGPGPGRPLELPDGCTRYVLAIGTIEPRKDYPLLLSAFTSLADDYPDVALVIVGGDGWGVDGFLRDLEASPFRSRILRPGYLDDVDLFGVLRNAAVLAYPSVYEGFGFPPLEAMAAGVPVVTTAAGSIPEVVGDGAILTGPGDTEGLAAALAGVLDGGPAIGELVERGSRRAAGFTWEACAEGLVGLYRDAADEHPRRIRR